MAAQVAKQVAIRARRPVVSAGIPVVAAKITAPGMPDWALTRPRITKLIAEGNRWCPLTLVTAPAGSGKTMALALWAAVEPGTVAWVTVDEFDNRPGVFWAHVVAALRRSGVAVREALPATQGRDSGHVFLLWLAAALAAQDRPVTLVLDDLHLLTDRTVLDGLDYVLRNTGAALRVLVAARMDPLLPLHRYRLAGELTEIGAGDLAFTIAEAGELMARHGCALTADSLECLTRRTEGWAAGLRLAAMSVRHTAEAGDWQLAATMVIDGLAISEIIQPWGSPCLASEFGGMPRDQAWTAPAPHLVCAAVALSAGRPESSTAALDIADGILAVLPADQEIASRLAAAIIRLTLSLRTGTS